MALGQNQKKKSVIIIGALVIAGLLALLATCDWNFEFIKSLLVNDRSRDELSEQLMDFGWRGYLVISVLSALQILCTFLPAEPVQVLGGFAFGFPVGLLCCMVGVLLGNTLIYMLQNIFGDKLRGFFVKKLNLNLENIANSKKATLIIFILYFLPAIPYGMICFLASSMGMSYRRYITVTVLGSLPSVCIGVGLGYIALASNWIVSLCVFLVLILIIIIMFRKKDALFTKLNHYAEANKSKSSATVQNVNGFLMDLLYFGARFYLTLSGITVKTVSKVDALTKPSIILCNHGSFIDFIYAAALLRKYRPHFIAARLYFYNSILGGLLRKVGAFPKSMFAMDMENAKNCLTVLRNKEMLAMMPEARLSTAGRFEDIQPATYSFIKKAGVDVYTIKLNGSYFADPKWGKGFRRGAHIEAELDILYTAEQLQSLTMEQLKSGIDQRLSYDDFRWLEQHPTIRYRSHTLAEGLENILTTCPVCKGKHTIKTKGNKLYCDHCGYLTSVNDRYGFSEGFQFSNFAQWYDWQMELLKQEILENPEFSLSSDVELRIPGSGKGLTRHAGYGACTLNREGLTYSGTKDGENVVLNYPLKRIYRLLFGAGENFEIYDGTQIQYFVPTERRSAVNWYMTSMILYDLMYPQEITGE